MAVCISFTSYRQLFLFYSQLLIADGCLHFIINLSALPPERSTSESDTTESTIWSPEWEESEEEYTVTTKVTL